MGLTGKTDSDRNKRRICDVRGHNRHWAAKTVKAPAKQRRQSFRLNRSRLEQRDPAADFMIRNRGILGSDFDLDF